MKQKKENSVALLLHWAGEQKFWLFLAILLSMCSGLCIIVPYIGIYRLMDFAYVPGEPVLKHATFTVPDQKLTAIVGDSGSGKSTILNLIAKYYEATSGTISIGGKPINHIAAERVLEQVSMVDQDVFLFDDTIRDNIRHARPNATDDGNRGCLPGG